jgi:DnaJ-class molecular chaperone
MKYIKCKDCKGAGIRTYKSGMKETCWKCHGAGKVEVK